MKKIERKNTHTTTTQRQNQEQEPGQLPGGVYETPDNVQAGQIKKVCHFHFIALEKITM